MFQSREALRSGSRKNFEMLFTVSHGLFLNPQREMKSVVSETYLEQTFGGKSSNSFNYRKNNS